MLTTTTESKPTLALKKKKHFITVMCPHVELILKVQVSEGTTVPNLFAFKLINC